MKIKMKMMAMMKALLGAQDGRGRTGAAAATALAVALAAGGAFGQGVLTVSKNKDINADKAMHTTIQSAVNAAQPGQIIEIQDTEVYEEQVTIDGRDVSPWAGVTGGKNGITIRSKNPLSLTKPIIRYRDTENTSPKNVTEARTEGDLTGTSGNRETNAALRILRAQNVTIEGIAVDGVSPYVFGNKDVWCPKEGGKCSAMFHGNSSIAVVVSGGAVVRNCEIKGAYFGISVKDRNTGGIFGNPNPSDNDFTVPLSGFGKSGNHLFEHNRVHDNAVGFYFESTWDLGSTVRYNLVYNNYFTSATQRAVAALGEGVECGNQKPGAFLFKDMYVSPLAIYNNTFYNNYANFIGNWKTGGQHLIFNNIFGKSSGATTGGVDNNGEVETRFTYMMIDHMFPNRMKYNTFSNIDRQQMQARCQDNFCADNPDNPYTPGSCFVASVKISNDGGDGTKSSVKLRACNGGAFNGQTQDQEIVLPGAGLSGYATGANNKWLEINGGTVNGVNMPNLFQSTDETASNFLEPKWDDPLVIEHIKNKGWPEAGIRNPDGTIADLGAIPSSSIKRHTIVARIKPMDVVRITSTSAIATFFLSGAEDLSNLKIKYIKWIYQIPDNSDDATWANTFKVVPEDAVRSVTLPANINIKGGNNVVQNIPVPTVPSGSNQIYGFFELTIEGTDKNGNTIASDVGFLPFRTLEYSLDIKFYKGTQQVTSVKAGEQVTMRVTPMKNTSAYTNKLDEIVFTLQSNPGVVMMWTNETTPFISAKDQTGAKDYTVFFKTAGDEIVSGAGISSAGGTPLSFLGIAELKVTPGEAAKVAFIDPIPRSQLGSPPDYGTAPVINRGVPKVVSVEVRDKYDNAVAVATPVSIVSEQPNIGDIVGSKTVNCGTNGIAEFTATVVGGNTNDWFDLVASITANNASDVGRLRLGRALDRLEVFYSDTLLNGKEVVFDPDAVIKGNVGDWFKVTVRVLVTDTVNTAHTSPKVVKVTADNGDLEFRATPDGAPATEFGLNSGVATFWVGSPSKEVNGACIEVEALTGPGGAKDGGIGTGNRCDITFTKLVSSIVRAVLYGDGHGRPDSLLVYYAPGGGMFTGPGAMALPSKVDLTWNSSADGKTLSSSVVAARGDLLLHVDFSGVADRPIGYTDIVGSARGLVKVYAADGGVEDAFPLIDGVGPVVAKGGEAGGVSPELFENSKKGVDQDTLYVTVSEQVRSVNVLIGKTLLYTADANPANEPATGGTELTVDDAWLIDGKTYGVAVAPITGGLAVGGWIRFAPGGGVVDRTEVSEEGFLKPDNAPHSGNRWVQLKLLEKPPIVEESWYTANSATGKVDKVYVLFDKEVKLSDWFDGGSVKFDKEVKLTAANLGTVFSVDERNDKILVIDLAAAYASSQSAVRTSGTMNFILSYVNAAWPAADVYPADRAAPVLADAVTLKIGSLKDDGTASPDTLVVIYSEMPGEGALDLKTPITIQTKGGPCEPVLTRSGPVVSAGNYYRATYVVDNLCSSFPEAGDSVWIYTSGNFEDAVTPPNAVVGYNLHQLLKIDRGPLKWAVTVRNNPFRSDAAAADAKRGASVKLEPGAKGAAQVDIEAHIMIFDNLGALVVDTLIAAQKEVDWLWSGANRRGRLVGTGTYLFKAVCTAEIKNASGVVEDKQRYAVTRSLGVVRGKN